MAYFSYLQYKQIAATLRASCPISFNDYANLPKAHAGYANIRLKRKQWEETRNGIANMLSHDNPNFYRDLFIASCEPDYSLHLKRIAKQCAPCDNLPQVG